MFALSEWRKRISIDPKVHHGDPCITGTRVPVSVLVGSIADGDSFDEILRNYPQLTREDLRAAVHSAGESALHIVETPPPLDPLNGSPPADEGTNK